MYINNSPHQWDFPVFPTLFTLTPSLLTKKLSSNSRTVLVSVILSLPCIFKLSYLLSSESGRHVLSIPYPLKLPPLFPLSFSAKLLLPGLLPRPCGLALISPQTTDTVPVTSHWLNPTDAFQSLSYLVCNIVAPSFLLTTHLLTHVSFHLISLPSLCFLSVFLAGSSSLTLLLILSFPDIPFLTFCSHQPQPSPVNQRLLHFFPYFQHHRLLKSRHVVNQGQL